MMYMYTYTYYILYIVSIDCSVVETIYPYGKRGYVDLCETRIRTFQCFKAVAIYCTLYFLSHCSRGSI